MRIPSSKILYLILRNICVQWAETLHILKLVTSLNHENVWWHLSGYCRLTILGTDEASWDLLGKFPFI